MFCLEEVQVGASVCPHCGSNLAPLQGLAEKHAALEDRIIALEQAIAARRAANAGDANADEAAFSPPADTAGPPTRTEIGWPHMADNIFLGLAALLAAHWLATTLPAGNRDVFRLVALIVALPFGYRFERNSRTGSSGQILAALAYSSLGTLMIGMLDMALAGHAMSAPTAQDIVASVAGIALSHYAGSALAENRQVRAEKAATASLMHIQTAKLKSTAETVKALSDAITPLAAGVAALWAAFGHFLL